ncbi:MAG: META domain-containing protein [Candidatus Promineifilaceae bacterium]
MSKGRHIGILVLFLALVPGLLLAACSSPSTPATEQPAEQPATSTDGTAQADVFLNPYRNECTVAGELRLCYVASLGDTGNFAAYEGEIENFTYEWGNAYQLRGSGDENSFRVEEVIMQTAEPGGVHFPLVLTGGGDRIVRLADGQYEFYAEKQFTCSDLESCRTLDAAITREQPISFEFQTPDDPADPLILLDWSSDTAVAQVGEEPGLLRGEWILQSITVEKDVTEPILAGTAPTAIFALDDSLSTGNVSGNGGCNDYSGTVALSGNEIDISEIVRAEQQCTNPPGVMDQEQRFVSALSVAESYSVAEDRLQIVYNNGNSVLHLVRQGQ